MWPRQFLRQRLIEIYSNISALFIHRNESQFLGPRQTTELQTPVFVHHTKLVMTTKREVPL